MQQCAKNEKVRRNHSATPFAFEPDIARSFGAERKAISAARFRPVLAYGSAIPRLRSARSCTLFAEQLQGRALHHALQPRRTNRGREVIARAGCVKRVLLLNSSDTVDEQRRYTYAARKTVPTIRVICSRRSAIRCAAVALPTTRHSESWPLPPQVTHTHAQDIRALTRALVPQTACRESTRDAAHEDQFGARGVQNAATSRQNGAAGGAPSL